MCRESIDQSALRQNPGWYSPEMAAGVGLCLALDGHSLPPTGTAMTPNFISKVNTTVALGCTCRGSGNLQDECEQLEKSFSQNPCLSAYAPLHPFPVPGHLLSERGIAS